MHIETTGGVERPILRTLHRNVYLLIFSTVSTIPGCGLVALASGMAPVPARNTA